MDRIAVERHRLCLFGRMAAGVAHEVDNHLSVVLGFAELLQLSPGNAPKVAEDAGKILASGEKVVEIIRNYSFYGRPHHPNPEPFEPARMIREILLFARYDLGRHDVSVTLPEEIPCGILRADRGDIGLTLLVLLFNGAEAMAPGGGELSLRAAQDAEGWEFRVADRGHGIPAGCEEKIFEEGFTTRGGAVHAGMGLPVARHLAGNAGGTVRAFSRPDGGSEFIVRIPPSGPG